MTLLMSWLCVWTLFPERGARHLETQACNLTLSNTPSHNPQSNKPPLISPTPTKLRFRTPLPTLSLTLTCSLHHFTPLHPLHLICISFPPHALNPQAILFPLPHNLHPTPSYYPFLLTPTPPHPHTHLHNLHLTIHRDLYPTLLQPFLHPLAFLCLYCLALVYKSCSPVQVTMTKPIIFVSCYLPRFSSEHFFV